MKLHIVFAAKDHPDILMDQEPASWNLEAARSQRLKPTSSAVPLQTGDLWAHLMNSNPIKKNFPPAVSLAGSQNKLCSVSDPPKIFVDRIPGQLFRTIGQAVL